jgi:hypothetical protein
MRKKLIIGLLFICSVGFGQIFEIGDTLSNGFIDYDQSIFDWIPDSADYGLKYKLLDGIDSTWSTITQEDSTAYLMARDSEFTGTATLTAKNSLIGAYGTGAPPIIDGKLGLEGDSTIVRDIKVEGYFDIGALNDHIEKTIIYNCEVTERAMLSGGGELHLYGNFIHNTATDGGFFRNTASSHYRLTMTHNRVVRINLDYFIDPDPSASPGDCFQVQSYDTYAGYNILDHSLTGNKFCYIIGDYATSPSNAPYTSLTEYNTMVMPLPTSNGGSGIYLADDMTDTVRNNFIYDISGLTKQGYGIYIDNVGTSYIYGNIIRRAKYDIRTLGTYYIFNNTIDSIDNPGGSGWSYAENNILFQDPTGMSSTNVFIEDLNTTTDFVDYANLDYRLTSISPAIDTGTNDATMAQYTTTIYGTPVPTSNIDAGADQYTEDEYINIDTAYAEDTYLTNTIDLSYDNNTSTAWGSQVRGVNGVYVLDSLRKVDTVAVWWWNNTRVDTFKLGSSLDSNIWIETSLLTSQAQSGYQKFPIDEKARYIRYTGFGNSVNDFNTIAELRIIGDVAAVDLDTINYQIQNTWAKRDIIINDAIKTTVSNDTILITDDMVTRRTKTNTFIDWAIPNDTIQGLSGDEFILKFNAAVNTANQ